MQIQFIEYRIWAKVEQVEKGQILTKNSVYGYFKGMQQQINATTLLHCQLKVVVSFAL